MNHLNGYKADMHLCPCGSGKKYKQCCVVYESSNAWDASAASAFGMQVVCGNRYGQRPERLPGKPVRMVTSLAQLSSLVGVA